MIVILFRYATSPIIFYNHGTTDNFNVYAFTSDEEMTKCYIRVRRVTISNDSISITSLYRLDTASTAITINTGTKILVPYYILGLNYTH